MKAIKNIVTVGFLLFAVGFSACEKVETGKNIPKCIEKKIKKGVYQCLNSVTEYIYIPQKTHKIESRIYEFSYGGPPCLSQEAIPCRYYDEQCNIIEVTVDDRCFEYNNAVYCYNRYVYQYYEKK